MSYVDLYTGGGPLISSEGDGGPTILGVPFDSTHSYRPGTRFGPDAIREAFNNIEVFHPGIGADLESAGIRDLGNTRHTVMAGEMIEMVGRVSSELLGEGRQIVILGGEHLITYGSYCSFSEDTGYVVFDAHYDLRDQYADAKLSHASYLRRIVESRGPENIIHVGARAYAAEELAFLKEHSIRTITDADIRDGRAPALLKDMVSAFDNTYVSCDLDVLDPAFAPGVGNPEAEGITSRELFGMLRALEHTKITGLDVVELNPSHDNGATAALAAKVVSTIIAMGL